MAGEFKIKGLDSVIAKLDSVKQDVRFKGGRFALRKAAQVFARKAKARALILDDKETGRSIAKNIVERWNGRLFKQTGDQGFRIGVLGGAKREKKNPDEGLGGKTFHWRYLQFGTEKQKATPIFVPQEGIDEAVQVYVDQFGKALDRAIKRGNK